MEQIRIKATGSGIPCEWERGGRKGDSGQATVITGAEGEALRPFHIREGDKVPCQVHALLPIKNGGFIVQVFLDRGKFKIRVKQVISTEVDDVDGEYWDARASVIEVTRFRSGQWRKPLPVHLEKAVKAAKAKAKHRFCRVPHYIDTTERHPLSEEAIKRIDRRKNELRDQRAKLRAERRTETENMRQACELLQPIVEAFGLFHEFESDGLVVEGEFFEFKRDDVESLVDYLVDCYHQ